MHGWALWSGSVAEGGVELRGVLSLVPPFSLMLAGVHPRPKVAPATLLNKRKFTLYNLIETLSLYQKPAACLRIFAHAVHPHT